MSEFPIIEKLGGRDAVYEALNASGLIRLRTRDALRMWVARKRIPGDALIALMKLAEQQKVHVRVEDLELSASEAA